MRININNNKDNAIQNPKYKSQMIKFKFTQLSQTNNINIINRNNMDSNNSNNNLNNNPRPVGDQTVFINDHTETIPIGKISYSKTLVDDNIYFTFLYNLQNYLNDIDLIMANALVIESLINEKSNKFQYTFIKYCEIITIDNGINQMNNLLSITSEDSKFYKLITHVLSQYSELKDKIFKMRFMKMNISV